MDNASKAIVISGGILIGVLIISVSMYVLATFRSFYEVNTDVLRAKQIAEFNAFFEKFPNGGEIKGYDAYSIFNKCQDLNNNLDGEFSANCVISVSTYVKPLNSSDAGISTSMDHDGRTISKVEDIDKIFYFTEMYSDNFTYKYEYNDEGAICNISLSKVNE